MHSHFGHYTTVSSWQIPAFCPMIGQWVPLCPAWPSLVDNLETWHFYLSTNTGDQRENLGASWL